MPPFCWPYLGSVRQEINVMIVKTSHVHTLHIEVIYKHNRGDKLVMVSFAGKPPLIDQCKM